MKCSLTIKFHLECSLLPFPLEGNGKMIAFGRRESHVLLLDCQTALQWRSEIGSVGIGSEKNVGVLTLWPGVNSGQTLDLGYVGYWEGGRFQLVLTLCNLTSWQSQKKIVNLNYEYFDSEAILFWDWKTLCLTHATVSVFTVPLIFQIPVIKFVCSLLKDIILRKRPLLFLLGFQLLILKALADEVLCLNNVTKISLTAKEDFNCEKKSREFPPSSILKM